MYLIPFLMSLPRNVEKRLIIFNGLKKREISDTGQ